MTTTHEYSSTIELTDEESPNSSGLTSYLPRWRPTSSTDLAQAEKRVLKFVKTPLKLYHTLTSLGKIWTLRTGAGVPGKKPLVMLHGMGAGVGMWVQNIDEVSRDRQLFAFDLLGFGRSSRPDFSDTEDGVEEEYITSIEEWRKEHNLTKFHLLGHSFGGYLATLYTLKYPQHVSHLILADPWGMPECPERTQPLPLRYRVVIGVLKPFNIFSGLRAAGPLGPRLVNKMRPDLQKKFMRNVKDVTAVPNYIYHCNVQHPSGEVAFKTLHLELGYAKRPLLKRMGDMDPSIPITYIGGAQSWMDPSSGIRIQELREGLAPVHVELILAAGHHVYADEPLEFNRLVNASCDMYDAEK